MIILSLGSLRSSSWLLLEKWVENVIWSFLVPVSLLRLFIFQIVGDTTTLIIHPSFLAVTQAPIRSIHFLESLSRPWCSILVRVDLNRSSFECSLQILITAPLLYLQHFVVTECLQYLLTYFEIFLTVWSLLLLYVFLLWGGFGCSLIILMFA